MGIHFVKKHNKQFKPKDKAFQGKEIKVTDLKRKNVLQETMSDWQHGGIVPYRRRGEV